MKLVKTVKTKWKVEKTYKFKKTIHTFEFQNGTKAERLTLCVKHFDEEQRVSTLIVWQYNGQHYYKLRSLFQSLRWHGILK